MPRRSLVPLLVLSILSTVASAQYGKSSGYVEPDTDENVFRRVEVVMEGGLALPGGNLGAELFSEDAALGAETGYMLGLRVRFYLSRGLTVAPAFAYTEFGDYDGLDTGGDVFTIVCRTLRYGVDFVYIKPGPFKRVRPFVGLGAALVRNKYREEYLGDETFYKASLNSFAWSVQAGLRWRDWEVSVDYELNRFSTARFLPTGGEVDYDWSHVVLRFGFALPRI